MALESPLMPSPTGPASALSPYADSPNSPVPFQPPSSHHQSKSSSTSGQSDSLYPPPSPYPQFVDPSPVDSNGTASTERTEIEDEEVQGDAQDNDERIESPLITSASPLSPESLLSKIDTSIAARTRADSDAAPQSVIHAPQDFKQFDSQVISPNEKPNSSLSPAQSSTNTILYPRSPQVSEGEEGEADDKANATHTSPLNTDIPSVTDTVMPTPRAQTRQELEEEWNNRRRSRHSMNLEGIPESQDTDLAEDEGQEKQADSAEPTDDPGAEAGADEEGLGIEAPFERIEHVNALKDGLSQCWTLCNTLANLSSNHRNQIFSYRGKSEVQEQAWRSCWKLCQNLYDSRDEDHQSQVLPTLEMCRDFCQALFEARQKQDEAADSVLRVSFELNNHLYNTHDRNLPSAFQERTLDFYLTLCHRLMKQRTSLPHETDALLRACWTLAEMLFSLRQNNREGKPPDEELLGSAVQACWDLCDLFREGWTQVRPDRGTPRPSQTAFSPSQVASQPRSLSHPYSDQVSNRSLSRSTSSVRSLKEQYQPPSSQQAPPETPTTIFDDANDGLDTDEEDRNPPNILVLGPDSRSQRWSSASSNYSESSQRTSSTATVPSNSTPHLNRLRVLIYKAALTAGFQPRSPPPSSSSSNSSASPPLQSQQHAQAQNQALITFIKAMPSDSFGNQMWQTSVLEKYRKFVPTWSALVRSFNGSGGSTSGLLVQPTQTRVTAAEVSRAVLWMMRNEQYGWIRDLFRIVFGCFPDDAIKLASVVVQA